MKVKFVFPFTSFGLAKIDYIFWIVSSKLGSYKLSEHSTTELYKSINIGRETIQILYWER